MCLCGCVYVNVCIMCAHVYMCKYMWACTCIHVHVYISVCIGMCGPMCVCVVGVYVYVWACVCKYMCGGHVCVYMYVCMWAPTCVHARVSTCTYTCVCTHTHTVTKKGTTTNHNRMSKNQRKVTPCPGALGVTCVCVGPSRGGRAGAARSRLIHVPGGAEPTAWRVAVIHKLTPHELHLRAPGFSFPSWWKKMAMFHRCRTEL